MIFPFLASAALGLVKGYAGSGPAEELNLSDDLWAPIREELVYRGAPLWTAPRLPYGTTALLFAIAHLIDDTRRFERDGVSPAAMDVVARFGDTFLGGLCYETAMRKSGIFAAIASHSAHNASVALGTKLRAPLPVGEVGPVPVR